MTTLRTTIAALGLALAAGAAVALAGPPLSQDVDPLNVLAGRALFEREWVSAPASTDAADGLGPLFNAKSCSGCHRGGGAAQFGEVNGKLVARGLVVKVSWADGFSHPTLGTQIQDRALPGLEAEGLVSVSVLDGALAVATSLRQDFEPAPVLETRIAPSLKGRGPIDLIDAAAVMSLADPDDNDGDGISGRAHVLTDEKGRRVLGRYGSKAAVASLMDQIAHAAALDLGLSSARSPFPHGDCTPSEIECLSRGTGQSDLTDGEELSEDMLALIGAYVRSLKVSRVDLSTEGARVFSDVGCSACHRPEMPSVNGGNILVFSDLLLHDMGDDLGSVLREGGAMQAEWRTAPLRDLNAQGGTRRYLHDGRAASIAEAIAHHGGEAAKARVAFDGLNGRDRELLLDFVSRL